jgi:YVTN family beta-propeller protein
MTKINKSAWLASALFITMFSACKKDETEEVVVTENYKGVLVVNEGGFLKSNATVGIYKPGSGDYFDAFKKANDRPLGDVIQSVSLINDRYYIVVNNSNKIEVVNKSDFKSVATITVSQPRYIVAVSGTKAYISQMNGTSMSILNLSNNTISGSIPVKASTESMALMNGFVYVGKSYADKLYVIDATTDKVTDSLTVGDGVSSIVSVSSTKIAVLCLGVPTVSNGKIAFINKDSVKIERSVALKSGSYSGVMQVNASTLYYNTGDASIYKMESTASTLPSSASITLPSGSVYGFAVDPSNSDVYIADAGDFNSAGKVYIYNSSNALVKQFTAGIVPSKFLFNN